MKKSTTSTPHDAVFKTLRHPETARIFMEIHLPVSLRDLRTLSWAAGCEKICEAYSRCALVAENARGRRLYIYVVIEHQSTPDAHMAFWLVCGNAMAAMQQHLDAGA